MTNGYGFKGFAGGLQTGLSLGLERQRIKALADERKALEKAKEEEKLAMNTWLMDNRESIENYSNLPQEERNWLIASSFQYSDKMATFFNDWDKAIKTNDSEEIKTKQKQWEDILATKKDLALAGVSLSDGFFIDGSEFDPNKPLIPPKETEYLKQIQMGKTAGGATGEAMMQQTWAEQGFGKITPSRKLSDIEIKMNLANKMGLSNEAKAKMIGAGDNAAEAKAKAIYAANGTDEDVVKAFGGGVIGPEPPPTPKVTPPVPTTTENIREDILQADTFKDAQRIHKNYVAKYGEETLGIADLEKEWTNMQTSYLDNINRALQSIVNEKGWLKTGTTTEAEVGIEFKGEQKVGEVYEMLREQYMKYRDMLEKMGVDVSQYPKLKPLGEIEKVGWLEGAKTFGGVGRGQYKSIYY
jgi:hypothetical protein